MNRGSSPELQPTPLVANATALWHSSEGTSLAVRFVLVAVVMLGCGTVLVSIWVEKRIERGVVSRAAGVVALHVERLLSPQKDVLRSGLPLSPEKADELDHVFRHILFVDRSNLVQIWAPGGTIIYSTDRKLTGNRRPVSESLASAFRGNIVSEYGQLNDVERDYFSGRQVLEVYVPIFSAMSASEVIAVAEVLQPASELDQELTAARLESGLVIASVSVFTVLVLFLIIRPASRTIADQRRDLLDKVNTLTDLLTAKETLQQELLEANRRVVGGHEELLRRLSAELHDGPLQLISLALMELDTALAGKGEAEANRNEVGRLVRQALNDASSDLRGIATGMALPEVENLSFRQAIETIVHQHETRTRTSVRVELSPDLPERLPVALVSCIYRFVQEGLTNAFRHGGGKDQSVAAWMEGERLSVAVSDRGKGFNPSVAGWRDGQLGLPGLRSRIKTMDGELSIISAPGNGTHLTASFRRNSLGGQHE